MTQYTTQAQLISALRTQLSTNERQALKALVRLYDRQTRDEQEMEQTNHSNGKGFTGCDAKILTSLAKQYVAKKFLTPNQMVVLMRIIPKYARQLVLNSIDTGKIRKEKGFYVW